MKVGARILISIIMFAFSTQLFAAKSRECPPIDMIAANSKFIKSFDLGDAWMLRSASFKANADSWAVVLMVKLPDAVTAEEALRMGQAYFTQNVTLSEPTIDDENDKITVCVYSNASDHSLAAIAPAVVIPHLSKMSGKWHI